MYQKSNFSRNDRVKGPTQEPGVIFDGRRSRTAWFEGQHVTADHFNRDQSYHLTRQADLGRAIGQGVAEGLEVSSNAATALTITAGLGLAPSGEVIQLGQDLTLDLADIPTQRRLNAALKSRKAITPAPETRSGLYILSASVVEYSSNPTASYPVSATSTRSLHDSLITEGMLFSLTPEPMSSSNADSLEWRSDAAWRIFAEGRTPEVPTQALPLAMVALEGNKVLWVDGPMVRRSLQAFSTGHAGVSAETMARRWAHFLQFDGVVEDELDGSGPDTFTASQIARSIPAMGRLPRATVARRAEPGGPMRLSQSWLPADVPVELVALPLDEIDALMDDAVMLPPIDLSADKDVLANTPITIIVPVARSNWMNTPAEVIETALPLKAPPAVGGRATDPEDLLRALMDGTGIGASTAETAPDAWAELLAGVDELWYMRRTQNQRADVAIDGIRRHSGDGEIVLPPSTGADLEPFIQTAFDHVRALHSDNNGDAFVEGLFSLEGEVALAFFQHLTFIHARGSLTGVFALSEALQSGRAEAKELIEKFPVQTFSTLTPLEYGIFGAGPLRFSASENDTQREFVRSTFEKVYEADGNTAAQFAETNVALIVPRKALLDDDFMVELLERAVEANFSITAIPETRKDEAGMSARARFVSTGVAASFAQDLNQMALSRLPEAVVTLRKTFLDASLSGEQLGDKLMDVLGGFV
ncbi:MAG: hypothetical protein WA790_01380 [Sulfitobacter sp.]